MRSFPELKRKLINYDNSIIPLPDRVGKVLNIPLNFMIQLKVKAMMHKTTSILFLSMLFLHSNQIAGQEFKTTWKVLAGESITIPTASGSSYYYTILWGDGEKDSNVLGDASHTYDEKGEYTVSISGTFPRINFNNSGDKDKIIRIDNWGSILWESMENAFFGCHKLQLNAEDTPDLSMTKSLKSMFRSCTQFTGNSYMKNWDTSTITDMSHMFRSASNFNKGICKWNTSSVSNTAYMFYQATNFNEDISYKPGIDAWNTHKVTNMQFMFGYASSFNQNIGNWNTSVVENMSVMFHSASNFDQDISYKINTGAWNTHSVVTMQGMFNSASSFNHDIGNWNTGKVKSMSSMFSFAENFNQDIGNWNTAEVIDMNRMFLAATNFNGNIGNWKTDKVTNMEWMFHGAENFNRDISYKPSFGAWNTSMVNNMHSMFFTAESFNQDIGNWNTSNVVNMNGMFYLASNFNQDISKWDYSSIAPYTSTDPFIDPYHYMANMLSFCNLSILNYDKLLQSLVDQNIVDLSLGNTFPLKYCNATAYNKLIDQMGWSITNSFQGSPDASTWVPSNATWYQDLSNWSSTKFPTLCTDVLIPDTKNISIETGQKAMAATLEVELGASLDIPLGAELIVDTQ